MSEMESTSPKPAEAGALLGALLSNPDLIRNVSALLANSGAGAAEQMPPASSQPSLPANGDAAAEGISRVLSNPEMMAKLPDLMKMLAPMVQQATGEKKGEGLSLSPAAGEEMGDRRCCRNDLLLALKPFLSPARCRAVDTLIGLSRLGDALQKLT